MHAVLRLIHQIVCELIELRTGDRHIKVLRAGRVRRNKRKVHVGLRHAGKLNLRLLRGFLQALERHAVRRKIDAAFALELFT